MRKIYFLTLSIFLATSIVAQEKTFKDNIDFDGYIQIRGTTDFDNYTSFSLRRLKLWLKSKPGFSEHWSYKIQVTFSSLLQEIFFLQDVKIRYKVGLFSFDIGQFVPQYSLQRFQPDYKLPSIERAKVVNTLIPDGTMGVRDIGVQANFKTRNNLFETHLGLFNGYGIKEYRFNNKGYMLVHKSSLTFYRNKIRIGYSVQYRYAKDLQIKFVLPDTVLFSGNDFRYNLFTMFKSKLFEIQAEYLNADLNSRQANGYYILSAININKSQFVLSYEDYNDLISETCDCPNLRLGYNYLIKGYKIKISFDNYFQIDNGSVRNYFTSIQFQMFIK